jgi:uncharacterized membrane protein
VPVVQVAQHLIQTVWREATLYLAPSLLMAVVLVRVTAISPQEQMVEAVVLVVEVNIVGRAVLGIPQALHHLKEIMVA